MKAILLYLKRETLWPLLVLALGVLVLLPGLGGYGFWEPHEIRVADQARARLAEAPADAETPAGADEQAEEQAEQAARQPGPAAADGTPPLTEWSVGQGIERVRSDELGARLPLALLGLAAVAVAFFLGRRLASPRAGLFSALVMLALPLLLFQSRQLMSQIGVVTGSGLVMLGLVGLAWPPEGRTRPPWRYAVDVALVALGAILSYYAAAALLGLVVPFGAAALAGLAGLYATDPTADATHSTADAAGPPGMSRARPALAGLVVLAAGLAMAVAAEPLGLGRPGRLALAVLPAALGALLFLYGILARRPRPVRDAKRRWQRIHLGATAALAGVVALGALAVVLYQVFDLRPPIPGTRALLGYSIVPANDPVPVLGGTWRVADELSATFAALFEQIAYGLFPWSVLAPIALVHLAMAGTRRGRRAWAGMVPFAWALLAWVVASILARKVGPTLFPASMAVAVGIGMWLDDLMSAREQADATDESDADARRRFGIPLHLPLVAVFVLMGAVVLGKDLLAFPEQITSLTAPATAPGAVAGTSIEYPADLTVLGIPAKAWHLIFGVLFGAALAANLWQWRRRRARAEGRSILHTLSRYGMHVALAIGVLYGLFLIHGWLPAMSRKLSSKHIFSVYRDLREDGARLGVMGNPGSGIDYYAGGPYEKLRGRKELLAFLREPARVFALAPGSELCAIHRAVQGDQDQQGYHVLDDSNAKFLLLSNQLAQGERDRNPLAQAIVREPPQGIETPLQVDYDSRIELIGVDMPNQVDRGDSFEMTLYFRVRKPVGGNWKIFAHFDGGGMRFQGDHSPINDRCSTSYWQPGDYIVDTFTVEAGNVTYAKTTYSVHVGFFRGSHGNWTNMPVQSARGPAGKSLPVGSDQRVRIGDIRVR